jgi:hypothetical protein
VRTYQIDLTLQVDAVNLKNAQRLVRLVGQDIERGQRRARCPGASGVTHAWMDLHPRELPEPEAHPADDLHWLDVDAWETDGGAVCA